MENQTTFDLNAAIQRWRGDLAKSGSFLANDLEELESHLRDSESLLRSQGLTGEEAFLIAVRRTGAGDVLAAEFAAINRPSVWLDRLMWMLTGSIAMSSLWRLMSWTLVSFGAVASLLVLPVLAYAVRLGLLSNRIRTFLRAPLGSPIAILLASFLSMLLSTALMDPRILRPISESYLLSALIINLAVLVQIALCIGVIAVFTLRRARS
jgi:hypothetical protein